MTFQSTTHPDRDNAFYALVDRFKSDLLRFCEVRCSGFGQPPSVAEYLVDNVFAAFARNPLFDFANAKLKDDNKAFLVYLNGIARNELTNIYRDQKKKQEGKWSDGLERIVTEIPPLPKNATIENQVKYEVLQELPFNHRVVYLTYMSYENMGCYLPRKLQKALREYLGISQPTVRVYKKEVLDRFELALKGFKFIKEE